MCDIVTENWGVFFEATPPMMSLPRILSIQESTIHDARYRWNANLHKSHMQKDQTVFQYTLSGCGAFDDGNHVHELPAGTGFLTNLHDSNYRYFYPEQERGELIVLWCMFESNASKMMTEEINRKYGYIFELPIDSGIIRRLLDHHHQERSRVTMTATENARLASEVLYAIMWSQEKKHSVRSEESLIERALAILEKHQGSLLNAGELADKLLVTREHLSRVFTKQLGTSPYRYIVSGKVDQAQSLLRRTTTPIKQIAFDLGFSSPAHFSEIFRKQTGIPPRDYRSTYRGG